MRSLTVFRCRGRRPRRPAEVSGGGRYAGGMNFSPTGYLLAGVGRKVAEGSRPLPTMQRIKGVAMARLRAGHARPLQCGVGGICNGCRAACPQAAAEIYGNAKPYGLPL